MIAGLNINNVSILKRKAAPSLGGKDRLRRVRFLLLITGMAAVLALSFPGTALAYVSISSAADLNLAAIPGTGGASEGTVTWTVATDAVLGYSLTVQASGAPAMTQNSYNIPDYPATTPETWSVASTSAAFGFSTQGPSTPTATWGTPASGAGKYRGFSGTSPIEIANRVLPTAGENTTVYFRAEVGSSRFQVSGTYTATITATATVTI